MRNRKSASAKSRRGNGVAKKSKRGEHASPRTRRPMPQDKRIVLHCKSGVRSAEVLAIVKAAGFGDAVHLGSGVVGWVNQIEPQKPMY